MNRDQFDFFQDELFLEDPRSRESSEDLSEFDPSVLLDTVVSATDWTTETIVSQINKNNIFLDPSFQRREAWTRNRKSAFIESIVLGFPIPPIVLAESKRQKGQYIVIDGKQRLLSIRQFWSKEGDSKFPILKLSELEIIKDLRNKTFEDLRDDPLFNEYLSSFENQSIRTIVIKNWKEESVLYHIFLRLNTGSLPLSPQELRQALHPGEFVNFVDKASAQSHALRSILRLDRPDFRMRDVELLVRYFAFRNYMPLYRGSLKAFLDDACKYLNRDWGDNQLRIERQMVEFENAYLAAVSVFGEKNVFRKWEHERFVSNFNRAIYDIVMYYFSFPKIAEAAERNKEAIVSEFKRLCQKDGDFLASIERTTKSIDSTYQRFHRWGRSLRKITGVDVSLVRLEDGKIIF